MKIQNVIRVDNVTLPTPVSYTVTRNDLDGPDTERSEAGYLNRDRLRAGMYTISVSWELPESELSRLTSALMPEKILVEFFDLTTCQSKTAYMYAASPTASVISPGASTEDMMCSYSCTLIEF